MNVKEPVDKIVGNTVRQASQNETYKSLTKAGVKWGVTFADKAQNIKLGENEKVDLKKEGWKIMEDIKNDLTDVSPLPVTFDFGYAMRAYLWSVVIMTSKTLGHRLARNSAVHVPLSIVPDNLWFGLVYIVMPACAIYLPPRYTEQQVSLNVRRIVLIILAFTFGLLGEHVWIHYLHFAAISAPSYYYPAVIGATLQVVGPHLANDRKALVGTCVTSAITISLSMALYYEALGIAYIITTCTNAFASAMNLQFLIADLKKGGCGKLTCQQLSCSTYYILI
ncbi:unnamed protein product [Bursaphelenchus okinawaensis]|uniref:Uncharacterized protein n=1 Tax=Bursaphelenchus okinawaensis TaxID=465554 RepID=A0A811KS76_9BILA|nr:unnamed protein product [Bursaphelenchus okinawaensis]CAG9112274.1 unnamed protein product [Bursaphelenchus okinawaensis]